MLNRKIVTENQSKEDLRKCKPERKRKRALAKALNDESAASSVTPVNESTALLVDNLTIAEKLSKITVMVNELAVKMNSGELKPQETEPLLKFLAQLNLFMDELVLALSQSSLEPQLENLLNLWLIRVKTLHLYMGELNLHRDNKPQAHRVLQVHREELVQQEQQIQQVQREVQQQTQQIEQARRQQQAQQAELQARRQQQQAQAQQAYQLYQAQLLAQRQQQAYQQEQKVVDGFLDPQCWNNDGSESEKRQRR